MKTNNENKELNKDSNKDLNKDLNKGSNEDLNKDLNKGSNEDLNKESNKDVTKKTNKESNGKKFKKIDFKELRKKSKEKRIQNKKNLKHGSYSMGAITIFIAIIVVLNLVLQEVPSKYREIDLSTQKLYSIGDQTKKVLKKLDKDVEIYYIAQSGSESSDIQKLLEKYEEGSDHIKVEQKDPAVNPKFVSQYTSDGVSNNSVIVVCGDKNKVIDNNSLYETTVNYQTYSSEVTGFDGEGQITSAINYVTSDSMPVMYTLEGHDEATMSDTLKDTIQKANIDIQSLNLLTMDSVPDDADILFIFAPAKDISEDEASKIISYLENGGKALIVSNYSSEEMPNFASVLENYGVKTADGIVLEGDTNHYISQNPSYLLPNIESNDITSSLSSGSRYILMPLAQGIVKSDNYRDSLEITDILTTSDGSYSKVNVEDMQTMEKESDDIDGPFAVGVSITENLDDEKETQIVYYSSEALFNDQMNTMVSGANYELISASVNWMCESEEDSNTISIASKSYDTSTLTIPAADASFWSIFVTAVVPVVILVIGGGIWMKRRKQ